MKHSIILALFLAAGLFGIKATAQSGQEKLDLPGDNLNLYSVLKLFQESETLEGFEKNLNDEGSRINNLDLNGDNKIDYIRVVDKQEGTIHNITLKVAVSKDESQDVAVFVVKKEPDGKVQIQVIGDEDLYGKDYIIEPNAQGTPNPGYAGNANQNASIPEDNAPVTEISSWPLVSYMFVPTYMSWESPWYWDNYPSYWQPWRPFYWHYYYGYHYNWNNYYNSHYRRWHNYRVPGWRDQYYGGGLRSRSDFVQTRYTNGDFQRTYTKPALANKGVEAFRREHPQVRTMNEQLPSFDNTGRPVIMRPAAATPVAKEPAITRPVNEPVTTKPVATETITTRPLATKPVITRHDTKETIPLTPGPANPAGSKFPVTKPVASTPIITNPPVTRPVVREPVNVSPPATRPVNINPPSPVTRPVSSRPISEPVNRPVNSRPLETRPATSVPQNNRPPAAGPGAAKPRKD